MKLSSEDLGEWRSLMAEALVASGDMNRGLFAQSASNERHAGVMIKLEELRARFIEEYDLDPEYVVVVAPEGTLLQGEKLGTAYPTSHKRNH